MKLAAAVTVNNLMSVHMDQDELKRFVLNSLSNEISKGIVKHMDIEEQKDIITDTTRYTGTITVNSNSIASSISGANGISGYTVTNSGTGISSYSQINLRVVEYTKSGKVTRVELQKYDEESDDWMKIPRIQIEE